MLAVKIITAILLTWLLWQDLKTRSVHVLLFPAVLAGIVVLRLMENNLQEFLLETALNLALLAGNLLLATLYFSLKAKKLVFLTQGLIGWGDILFFILLAVYFPFPSFALVFPLSLVFALFAWLLFSRFARNNRRQIPLAGLQSIFLIVFLFTDFPLTSVQQLIS